MEGTIKFNLSPARRAILLICVTVFCYIVASIIAGFMFMKGITASKVCIVTVLQDVLVFILPAVVTAVLITRRPADFLTIDRRPGVMNTVLTLAALVSAIPLINVVIQWNETVSFPEWASGMEQWMRQMEESASKTISTLVNGDSVMSLVMLILVVGFFAGFSEELFFRGTVQRMMITARVNPHLAIWITAFLFSAVHFQFFGFVPRMLLGAMFGYMAWWSGSVWLSAIAHITNNCMAAVAMWMKSGGNESGFTTSSISERGA